MIFILRNVNMLGIFFEKFVTLDSVDLLESCADQTIFCCIAIRYIAHKFGGTFATVGQNIGSWVSRNSICVINHVGSAV